MIDYVGQQRAKYHLVCLLGRGGFGDVYLGEHVEDGTQAAVKILHEPLSNENINEFVNEAGLCKLLNHEHIVRLLEVGMGGDNIPFLVMEYAPNGSLADRHSRGTRLPLETIVSYVKPIASALQYAHDKGLIHRDVKPANFLVGKNGKVLLGDFGITEIVHSTRSQKRQKAVGTWPYAPPEQFVAKAVPASDQYSLAVVVYEWLCGEQPFRGTFEQLARQHDQQIPPPPLHGKMIISPIVEQVVMRALKKDPKQRFQSVQAFADALEYACFTSASQSKSKPLTQPPVTPTLPDRTLPPNKKAISPFQPPLASPRTPIQAAWQPPQVFIHIPPPNVRAIPFGGSQKPNRRISRHSIIGSLAGLTVAKERIPLLVVAVVLLVVGTGWLLYAGRVQQARMAEENTAASATTLGEQATANVQANMQATATQMVQDEANATATARTLTTPISSTRRA